MREITVSASPDQIDAVMEFVNGILSRAGCPEETQAEIDVAVDELFGNIALYAYGPETGTATVRAETEEAPPTLILTFMDRGMPFDPLANQRPDTTALPAKERPIGGLGLLLVRGIMDDIAYRYEDGMNVLTVRKKFCDQTEEDKEMAIAEIEKNGNTLTVRPEGRLDTARTPLLDNELKQHLDGVSQIVMDLSKLEYVSSSGLRLLLWLEQKMEDEGGEVQVINANQTVLKIFEMAGFMAVLNVITD